MNREQKKKIEQQILKQQEKNKKTVEEWLSRGRDHKKPVTRRDFLVAGVQATMGSVAAPSIFALLDKFNRAHGAECAAGAGANLVPWIQFNFRGGWGLAGNWAPFDAGDNKLDSYTTLSWGANPDIVTNVFGNGARFYDNGGGAGGRFLQGLRATAGDAILANCSFVGVPCRSTDDSSSNDMDGTGVVMNAGLTGIALPNLERVRHQSTFGINAPAPLNVDRFNDLAGALGFAGALGRLESNQIARVAKLVQDLSTSQARKLASLSGGQNIMELVECATGQNHDNIANQTVGAIDPRQSLENDGVDLSGIYDLNNGGQLARASIVYNSLNGVAGPSTLEFGGYDYHNQGRTSQDQDDLDAGEEVGRVLQMASALGKKVFIPLLSDGSVSCSGTNQNDQFRSDSGSRGCLGFIAFDPAAAPATNGTQIGSFTSGQVADRSFTTGDSPERAVAAIIVNWAKMSGDISLATQALPNNTFSTAQIDQILRIV